LEEWLCSHVLYVAPVDETVKLRGSPKAHPTKSLGGNISVVAELIGLDMVTVGGILRKEE
jgi:hypothetical protein